VLLRRALWESELDGTDRDDLRAEVDAVITRMRELGLLDDAAFAEARARRLFLRGAPRRKVLARLADKGVSAETARNALNRVAQEGVDPDLRAVIAFARRRRLGPWRSPELRAEMRERDAATLARAGFTWSLARTVIEAPSIEALEAKLDD
jgi:regulatory protein